VPKLYASPTILYHNDGRFSPLVYAKRYADKPVVKLLLKYGAKMGKADPKIVKEWIKEGKLDL